MSGRIHLFSAAVALGCILHASQVLACQPCGGSYGYVLDLDDGQHVFVMKNPGKRTSVCLELWNGVYQTIEEAQAACLERYAFNDPRGAICAWDLRKPITTETQLQEKCVFEFTATDPQDFYPHSGVYTTDSPRELVWKWEGRYLGFSEVKRGISRDARLLVVSRVPASLDESALVVYEMGRAYVAFPLSSFVGDISEIPLPHDPCGCGVEWTWHSTWDFDSKRRHLVAETHAGLVLSIDVATGQILEKRQIRRITVDGYAVLDSGKRVELASVRNCGFAASFFGVVSRRREADFSEVPTLGGYLIETDGGQQARMGSMVSISLASIRSMIRTDRRLENRSTFRITFQDGSTQELLVGPAVWVLCAEDGAGKDIMILPEELQTLTIRLSSPGV